MTQSSLVHYLDDRFDLDGDPERQASNPNCGSRVLGAEDLLEQVRAPIDHSGMLAELWYCIDHPQQLDDPLGAIQTTKFPFEDGEDVQAGEARVFRSFLSRDICPYLAFGNRSIRSRRHRARQVDGIAHAHCVRVVGGGDWHFRKLKSKLLDSLFDRQFVYLNDQLVLSETRAVDYSTQGTLAACQRPRKLRNWKLAKCATPNPSLHPTCYGWLRQPSHAGELKR